MRLFWLNAFDTNWDIDDFVFYFRWGLAGFDGDLYDFIDYYYYFYDVFFSERASSFGSAFTKDQGTKNLYDRRTGE